MSTQRNNIGESSSSSSPPSSSSSPPSSYRVFLSFRGLDVGRDFGDFLYRALGDVGMTTFWDDDEDKDINKREEIKKAIRESKVVIIIFSQNFASSPYCLEQAAMFIDRWREKKVEVLPVLFKVKPADVWDVKGMYGEEFEKQENNLKEKFQGEELERWKHRLAASRAALQQVSEVTPRHVYGQQKPRYLSEFIRDVVADAKRLADLVMLDTPSHVVGQPYRFLGLERWVRDPSHDKRIALLHGAQGIGRKTIAVVVSNQNYSHFDATVFLDDVAERSRKPNGIVQLQRQLLSRLVESKGNKKEFSSEKEGKASIVSGLKNNNRVLIVLAGLDQGDQLFKLIPGPEFLQKGSKVMVTSGDENLLEDRLCEKFPVKPLTPAQSLELFSWYAFGKAAPKEEYKGRVVAALRRYSGNPSVIKAFASFFSSLGMDRWDDLLPGTSEEDPKLSVSNRRNDLKSSFDSLEEDDKVLFLDIACFYAGRSRDHVDLVLNNCNMYKEGGFDRLRTRHLVSVDDKDNKVTMDQAIMDMGRDIVGKKKTNIWSPEDAFQALRNREGTKYTRSFVLQDGRQLETSEMEIKTEAFSEMTNLKLLQLANINIKGDFKYFPKHLVWLSLDGMSFHQMPGDILLNDLVILDVHNSGLRWLWSRSQSLGKLKILEFKGCHMLEKTPDFSCLHVPNLERLILEDCIRLVQIHSSIECLAKLVHLCLKGCVSLEELPTVVGSRLKVLDISGCTGLRAMPSRSIESVVELCADQVMVDQLWAEPAGFTFSAVFPCLVTLSLVECNLSDEQVTGDLAMLHSLRDLDLRVNPLTSSPQRLLAQRPSLRVRF